MEAPAKIEVRDGANVVLSWPDGTVSLEARVLRAACVCADCRSERGTILKESVLAGSEPITVRGAELRGAYAIAFTFGPDGHSTGIFTWDLLHELSAGAR